MRRFIPAALAALAVILTVLLTQSFVFIDHFPESTAAAGPPHLERGDDPAFDGPDRPASITFHRQTLLLAFATVESGCDESAVGPTDDLGWLQITPVLVRECNRILGREEYTLEDRLSRERSEQMFGVIQDYYNPSWNIVNAARRWNPGAGDAYVYKVLRAYSDLMMTYTPIYR